MEPNFRRLRDGLRRKLALIAGSFAKLPVTLKPGDFQTQRMCPFCGLITARQKTCCLECGKSLRPA